MIGNGYWAVGITVRYGQHGWGAEVEFYDDGFGSGDGGVSTEGVLRTRYYVSDGGADGLETAVGTIKADAERLRIRFQAGGSGVPYVYYKGDGEDEQWPPPPGWREMVDAQSVRLGWRGGMYSSEVRT